MESRTGMTDLLHSCSSGWTSQTNILPDFTKHVSLTYDLVQFLRQTNIEINMVLTLVKFELDQHILFIIIYLISMWYRCTEKDRFWPSCNNAFLSPIPQSIAGIDHTKDTAMVKENAHGKKRKSTFNRPVRAQGFETILPKNFAVPFSKGRMINSNKLKS